MASLQCAQCKVQLVLLPRRCLWTVLSRLSLQTQDRLSGRSISDLCVRMHQKTSFKTKLSEKKIMHGEGRSLPHMCKNCDPYQGGDGHTLPT